MANDAHVAMVGTVMADPKSRQVNDSTVLDIRLAVTTTKKQEGSQYPASDFYDVKVWGKLGERLMQTVKAKSKLFVTGDMYMGEPWQDRDGNTHINPIVRADSIKDLTPKSAGAAAPQQTVETEEAPF